MDSQAPDGELLIRIDEKLGLLMSLFSEFKADVQRDFDEVWVAIDRTRTDIGELRKFEAEIKGASRSLNWVTHLVLSLPLGALAGVIGFFAGR